MTLLPPSFPHSLPPSRRPPIPPKSNWNLEGTRGPGAQLFAIMFGAAKRSLSLSLVLMVCMGYGVVRPSLGQDVYKILGMALVYFFSSAVGLLDRPSFGWPAGSMVARCRDAVSLPLVPHQRNKGRTVCSSLRPRERSSFRQRLLPCVFGSNVTSCLPATNTKRGWLTLEPNFGLFRLFFSFFGARERWRASGL